MDSFGELLEFLSSPTDNIRNIAVDGVLKYSKNQECISHVENRVLSETVKPLCRLLQDQVLKIQLDATSALVNLTADSEKIRREAIQVGICNRIADVFLDRLEYSIVSIADEQSKTQDTAPAALIEMMCILLSNISTEIEGAHSLLQAREGILMQKILHFIYLKTTKVNQPRSQSIEPPPRPYRWIPQIFTNIAKLPEGRRYIINEGEKDTILLLEKQLLENDGIIRLAATSTFRNLFFDTKLHDQVFQHSKTIGKNLVRRLDVESGEKNLGVLRVVAQSLRLIAQTVKGREMIHSDIFKITKAIKSHTDEMVKTALQRVMHEIDEEDASNIDVEVIPSGGSNSDSNIPAVSTEAENAGVQIEELEAEQKEQLLQQKRKEEEEEESSSDEEEMDVKPLTGD